jgi:hypothetical protein
VWNWLRKVLFKKLRISHSTSVLNLFITKKNSRTEPKHTRPRQRAWYSGSITTIVANGLWFSSVLDLLFSQLPSPNSTVREISHPPRHTNTPRLSPHKTPVRATLPCHAGQTLLPIDADPTCQRPNECMTRGEGERSPSNERGAPTTAQLLSPLHISWQEGGVPTARTKAKQKENHTVPWPSSQSHLHLRSTYHGAPRRVEDVSVCVLRPLLHAAPECQERQKVERPETDRDKKESAGRAQDKATAAFPVFSFGFAWPCRAWCLMHGSTIPFDRRQLTPISPACS